MSVFETDIDRIRTHVEKLATVPRPYGSRELDDARAYVSGLLEESGWNVTPQEFDIRNDAGELQLGENLHGINLVATRSATAVGPRPKFLVGAHLDSRPDTPGADDNASAVAALLEIARLISHDEWTAANLDLELVAFDLEENGMLGGRECARLARESGIDLRGMVSLEMLGYCDPAPGSQQLPRSLVGKYPDTGDFIAVIGNQNSTTLIEQFRAGMELIPGLSVESLQVPENGELLQATRLSDHSPFWDAGYPALMITDTSFLRNPHYHQMTDTPDTLDFKFLHRVAEGSLSGVRHIVRSGLM